MNPKIRNYALSNSETFWLDLSLETLEKRLINSKKRPLLNTLNVKETLDKIYIERIKIYALANYRIDCNKLNSNKIVDKIITLYANN